MSRLISVDVGTGNIVCAEKKADKLEYYRVKDAFFKINISEFITGSTAEFGETMLKKAGANYIKMNNVLYILGDDAFKFANIFHKECLRPMAKGVLNPYEPESNAMVAELIRGVAGKASSDDDIVYYCVPANPIDADFDVVYHASVIKGVLQNLGYKKTFKMNEGLAVVYSELEKEQYSGIGMSCLTHDAPIITNRGVIPIENINIGDRVLTKNGKYEKVLNKIINEKSENIQEITFFSSNVPLKITSEHLIYVLRNGEEKWIAAEAVNNEDYVLTPSVKYSNKKQYINFQQNITSSKKQNIKHYEVSERMARFIGLFLGDGHVELSRGGIFFDFGKKDENLCNFVDDVAENIFDNSMSFIDRHEGKCIRCQMNNNGLAKWFKNRCYDTNENKKLPWEIDDMDRPTRLGILFGLLQSDGYIGENIISFENTSSQLTLIVMQLCNSEGISGSYIERDRNEENHKAIIKDREIKCRKTYSFRVDEKFVPLIKEMMKKDSHSTRNFIEIKQWNKVRENKKINYTGKVFDLTIENEHSFCVPGCCVHNCGAGMINVAFSFLGMPIFSFSVSRSGDYLDSQVAKATNETNALVQHIKEQGIDLNNPKNKIEQAYSSYYDALINYVIDEFRKLYISTDPKKLPKILDPIKVVVSGGTSMPKGFIEKLDAEIKEGFPVPVSQVILADDPLFAVSRGLYNAAKTKAESEKKV